MKYQVIVLSRAQQDIQRIYEWIAQRSASGAARWFNRFTDALATLSENPKSCGLAPENEFVDQEIRHLIFKTRKGRHYRALFTITENPVDVLHVRGPGQPLVDPEEL